MVLQYKLKKGGRWIDYNGKEKFSEINKKRKFFEYEWRLLNHDKTKILVQPTNYTKAMKRFKQIEFFKRK
jgi:hypothetical protein